MVGCTPKSNSCNIVKYISEVCQKKNSVVQITDESQAFSAVCSSSDSKERARGKEVN